MTLTSSATATIAPRGEIIRRDVTAACNTPQNGSTLHCAPSPSTPPTGPSPCRQVDEQPAAILCLPNCGVQSASPPSSPALAHGCVSVKPHSQSRRTLAQPASATTCAPAAGTDSEHIAQRPSVNSPPDEQQRRRRLRRVSPHVRARPGLLGPALDALSAWRSRVRPGSGAARRGGSASGGRVSLVFDHGV